MQRIVGSAIMAAVFFALSAFRAGDSSPKARYEAAWEVLCPNQNCFDAGIGDAPKDVQSLNQAWSATQDWTIDFLNAHPDTTTGKLKAALLNADPRYQPINGRVYVSHPEAPEEVVQLAPDIYGASDGFGGPGNAFLVARQAGSFRVVWDSRTIPAEDLQKFPVLRSWQTVSARDSCRTNAQEGQWDECGPISGSFVSLPPDSRGQLRFYIVGGYTQLAGETVAGQISIWSWDGRNAAPLLAKSYVYDLEDVHVGFAHGVLTIRVKEEYQSYYSCGACLGRQGDWRILITSNGVTDLRTRPLNPELDTVDALFQAIGKHRPTENLANPYAMTKLDAILKSAADRDKQADEPELDLGMLDYSSVRREDDHAIACISVDAIDQGIVFTIKKKHGHDYVTDVNLKPEDRRGKC